jgi:hypothetical protein
VNPGSIVLHLNDTCMFTQPVYKGLFGSELLPIDKQFFISFVSVHACLKDFSLSNNLLSFKLKINTDNRKYIQQF